MDVVFLIFITIFIVLISLWITQQRSAVNQLPGPIGLPIVGYIPFLTKKPYKTFQQLAKKYGPVYKVQLGRRSIVVLCDFKNIKDAFSDDAFIGRPPDLPFELSEESIRTGAFLGMPWKEQRRFAIHTLRDLGFGKTKMEDDIKEEILEVVERLEEMRGRPVAMSDILATSTSNNVASLLFGKRLKYDDPKRKELNKLLRQVGLLAGATSWQLFFPGLRAVMKYFNLGSNGRLSRAQKEVRNYCLREIEEHETSLDADNIRDFIDRYLLEIQKNKQDPNSVFKKDVLADLSRTFFGAGSETVRITVEWMLLLVAAYPDVQERIHDEIDHVIGRDRFPTWQDRPRMPYTEAAILELMRWRTIIPMNIMRYSLKDFELNGYFIPKNSYILAVFYCLDHDKNLWGKDVDQYKMERFLSEDKKTVIRPEHFIPFSIGKRSCPGKTFAEIEVYLYFVSILQKFKLSLPPGKQAKLEGVLGIGLQPERQEICLESR